MTSNKESWEIAISSPPSALLLRNGIRTNESRPQVVQNLLITRKTNSECVYAVKLCIDGIWRVIGLDDYVPVKNNSPAFSHSHENEAWVLFLEKAWAKSFGNYSNIIAGDSREVFKSVMGGPTWVLKTDAPDFKD